LIGSFVFLLPQALLLPRTPASHSYIPALRASTLRPFRSLLSGTCNSNFNASQVRFACIPLGDYLLLPNPLLGHTNHSLTESVSEKGTGFQNRIFHRLSKKPPVKLVSQNSLSFFLYNMRKNHFIASLLSSLLLV